MLKIKYDFLPHEHYSQVFRKSERPDYEKIFHGLAILLNEFKNNKTSENKDE